MKSGCRIPQKGDKMSVAKRAKDEREGRSSTSGSGAVNDVDAWIFNK